MYQLMYEDLARSHQRELQDQAEQSRAAVQLARLARAERRAQRAQAAVRRARRPVGRPSGLIHRAANSRRAGLRSTHQLRGTGPSSCPWFGRSGSPAGRAAGPGRAGWRPGCERTGTSPSSWHSTPMPPSQTRWISRYYGGRLSFSPTAHCGRRGSLHVLEQPAQPAAGELEGRRQHGSRNGAR